MKIFIYSLFLMIIGINLNLSAQTNASNIVSHDTRNNNWGPTAYTQEVKFEFKTMSVIGVPGSGLYSGLLTLAPWIPDGTGGKHHQLNFNDGGVYYRSGLSYTSTWGTWRALVIENENGNVGIGTTTPTNRLEVNGTIKTKEVNVTTAGWPDYVFAADYNLMPLDSLSEFIKTNSHLPGVPSESEVNLNGANLGEMNVILLKKIEELTLYVIGQENSYEKAISSLKEEIEALKQIIKEK